MLSQRGLIAIPQLLPLLQNMVLSNSPITSPWQTWSYSNSPITSPWQTWSYSNSPITSPLQNMVL